MIWHGYHCNFFFANIVNYVTGWFFDVDGFGRSISSVDEAVADFERSDVGRAWTNGGLFVLLQAKKGFVLSWRWICYR